MTQKQDESKLFPPYWNITSFHNVAFSLYLRKERTPTPISSTQCQCMPLGIISSLSEKGYTSESLSFPRDDPCMIVIRIGGNLTLIDKIEIPRITFENNRITTNVSITHVESQDGEPAWAEFILLFAFPYGRIGYDDWLLNFSCQRLGMDGNLYTLSSIEDYLVHIADVQK